jgi:hypothetical protein
MDAEGRIIEVVEDDMGEGFADEAPPDRLEEQFQAFEARIEAEKKEELTSLEKTRPEGIPARAEEKPNPHDVPVKWVTELPKGVTVLLMIGVEQNCPVVFQKAYRVAGSRENGKLILKPAIKKGR